MQPGTLLYVYQYFLMLYVLDWTHPNWSASAFTFRRQTLSSKYSRRCLIDVSKYEVYGQIPFRILLVCIEKTTWCVRDGYGKAFSKALEEVRIWNLSRHPDCKILH